MGVTEMLNFVIAVIAQISLRSHENRSISVLAGSKLQLNINGGKVHGFLGNLIIVGVRFAVLLLQD